MDTIQEGAQSTLQFILQSGLEVNLSWVILSIQAESHPCRNQMIG